METITVENILDWDIKGTPTLGKFHTALALAQRKMINPTKNRTAKIGTNYTFEYADLPSGIDIVRRVLSEVGMAFYQVPTETSRGLRLVSRLAFEDEWIEASFPISSWSKMTELGGQITFLRRYSLFPLAGVAGEEDIDGDAIDASGAKAVLIDETPKLDKVNQMFQAAKTLGELAAAQMAARDLYGQLSVVGQAAVRRTYVELEKRLKEKVVPNDGNSDQGKTA